MSIKGDLLAAVDQSEEAIDAIRDVANEGLFPDGEAIKLRSFLKLVAGRVGLALERSYANKQTD